MQNEDDRKRREMESMRGSAKMQELEQLVEQLQKQLLQERERNRALRFKSGQVFLSCLEKGGATLAKTKPGSAKNVGDDYYLADDEALMRLLQRMEQLGEPRLEQRLRNAGDGEGITRTQFVNFLGP